MDNEKSTKHQASQEYNRHTLLRRKHRKKTDDIAASADQDGEKDAGLDEFITQESPKDDQTHPVEAGSRKGTSTKSECNCNLPHEPYDPENPNRKFHASNRYFTICVYAIAVIFFGAIIVKIFVSLDGTLKFLKDVTNILMPFFIGALIAFILNPAVKRVYEFYHKICRINNKSVCKGLSIATTYILLLGLIIVTLLFVMPQIVESITELVNYVPTTVDNVYHFFDNLEEHFPNLDVEVIRKAINDAIPNFITYLKDFATNLVPALYTVSVSILQWILNVVIAIIVSIYMLSDKKPLLNSIKGIIYAFVPVKHIRSTIDTLKTCNQLFSSFIIGKAIDSLIIGLLCFVIMSLCQLPYAVLISAIVGVTNMIPYFGPFIGAVPGVLIMLLVSPIKALIFAILILVLQQFDGLILGPKILGDSTGLKPLWIIFAITIGGSIAGVLGMFLGVPVIAVLRYLLNRFLQYRLEKRNFQNSHDFNIE